MQNTGSTANGRGIEHEGDTALAITDHGTGRARCMYRDLADGDESKEEKREDCMNEQENPLERDGTVVMPRFQSAMADLKTRLRELQEEAAAKRLAELRSLIHEEVERALHPGLIDTRQYRHVDITDADGKRWRGMVYAVEPVEEEDATVAHWQKHPITEDEWEKLTPEQQAQLLQKRNGQ